MSIFAPPKDWFKNPHGSEKTWIAVSLIWCMVMLVMMPYWHLKGKQNSNGETYRVEPDAFVDRVNKYVETNQVSEFNGIPVVQAVPGQDVYLLGRMWEWYPIIKLKKGQTYRIHISSSDLQHGFSVLPINMNFQILPGYDHVLTITPTRAGDYPIVCNEFCGIGHHNMTGKFIVEE
jgi:cytochrome c oxidase subunit 2